MKPRRDVDPETLEAWNKLRTEAATALEALMGEGPGPDDDLLDQLAWRSGFPEPDPFDVERVRLVLKAMDERRTWREIALALGFGENEVRRCQSMYHYRASRLD